MRILAIVVAFRFSESPKKKRKNVFYRHRSVCNISITAVELSFPECEKKTVITYGCSGYCASEASVMIYRKRIVPKCTCCKPVTYFYFDVGIKCPDLNERLKYIPMLAAQKCSCQPCVKYMNIQTDY